MTDLNQAIEVLQQRFNPAMAGHLSAVFQFQVDGQLAHLEIANQACVLHPGQHPSPTVTLTLSAATLKALLNGEISGFQAFLSGQLQFTGDVQLLSQIKPLFSL
jgi:putative sterol carrier protein